MILLSLDWSPKYLLEYSGSKEDAGQCNDLPIKKGQIICWAEECDGVLECEMWDSDKGMLAWDRFNEPSEIGRAHV